MTNRRITAAIAAIAATGAMAAPAALASGGDDDVRRAGECSANSTSKIKAKPDDGRIEVEFEVDQNRNGVAWNVRLKDNGNVVFRGQKTTRGPSGSFSLERKIDNRPGSDSIKGIAKNPASGERCVARVTL